MTRTLVQLYDEILPSDYASATESLARISAWELSKAPETTEPQHTAEVVSSYLLSVVLATDGGPEDWENSFANGLIEVGYDEVKSRQIAQHMTSLNVLRKTLQLKYVKGDEPNYGLRVKSNTHRYIDEPRFVYAASRLSN